MIKTNLVRLSGKILVGIASLSLLATCVYLLISNQPGRAPWPAIAAGILGYILLKPGKRSVQISMGGVVVDIISDDTGVLRKTTDSAVSNISQEISERTRFEAIGKSTPPPLPM